MSNNALAKETLGEKPIAEHDSNISPPSETVNKKPTRWQRYKRHHKRFWWVYLIIFIICVLVITLPVIYVGYPRIAQDQINDSTLTVNSMTMTNPTPDSLTVTLNSTIGTKSSYHPTLDPFPAEFYLRDSDEPFLNLLVPKQKSVHDGDIQLVHQVINVTEQPGFNDYAAALLLEKELDIKVKGKTKLKQGGLPKVSINYNQEVKVAAFDGLAGLETSNLTVLTTQPQPDNATLTAQVTLQNPTVTTLDLGNVTLNITTPLYKPYPENITLGTATILNVNLPPGPHVFPLRSIADQQLVVRLFAFNNTYRETGHIPVYVQAINATYFGQNIPYLSNALKQKSIFQSLDVGSALRKAGLGAILGDSQNSSTSTTSSSSSAAETSATAAA